MYSGELFKPSYDNRAPGGTEAFNPAYPYVVFGPSAGLTTQINDADPAHPLADGTVAVVLNSGVDTKVFVLDTYDARPANGTSLIATQSGVGLWVEITALAVVPPQLFQEIVWDPSVVASVDNVYKTWPEVEAAVNAVHGAAEVQINSSPLALATIPNTAVLDGKHMTRLIGARNSGLSRATLDIQDGAVLTHIALLQDLTITPTLPAANTAPFVLGGYMRIENCFIKPLEGSAGTNGILQLNAGEGGSATVFVDQESTIDGTRASAALVCSVGTLTVVGTRDSTITTQGVLLVAGASIAYLFDASVPMPFASSPGYSYRLIDIAQGVGYSDTTVSPTIVQTPGVAGPTTQQAVDALKPFTLPFVDGDLVAGILTVNHNLGQLRVFVTVSDDGEDVVIPTNIKFISPTQLTIDMLQFQPLTGPNPWNVTVRI
jgi:hypothetical protein